MNDSEPDMPLLTAFQERRGPAIYSGWSLISHAVETLPIRRQPFEVWRSTDSPRRKPLNHSVQRTLPRGLSCRARKSNLPIISSNSISMRGLGRKLRRLGKSNVTAPPHGPNSERRIRSSEVVSSTRGSSGDSTLRACPGKSVECASDGR